MNSARSCSQTCRTLVHLIAVIFLQLCGVSSAWALNKPANVKATFNPSTSELVVSWDAASGAREYQVSVKDPKGVVVTKAKTTSLKRKFAGSKFQAAASYNVKVKSISGSSSSGTVSVKYLHELSRAPGEGVLRTVNAFGRAGSYYLPPKFGKKARPLMVVFHGQGGSGKDMVGAFRNLADEFGFIIIAPSSGFAPDGTPTWEIGVPNSPTADFLHIESCMTEVLGFANVKIDAAHILAAGHSAGAAVAPYFSTNSKEFTNFAVLHGGVFLASLGPRRIPGWFSTGNQDTLRPPVELQTTAATLDLIGFNDVIYTSFDTGHDLSKKERRGVVEWWLK